MFKKIGCDFKIVSRFPNKDQLSYDQLSKKIIKNTDIIVNASPIGTYPNIMEAPNIPYKYLNSKHLLFDLIYNPKETEFLKRGKLYGSKTSNGLKMLKYQADKSWELWSFLAKIS